MRKLTLKSNTYSGKLIVFEGTDGAGKTTMIGLTRQLLEEKYGEEQVISVKQPTDMSRKTKLFQKMMYSRNHEEIDYRAVQLLTMSDRVQHCFETVSLYPTRYSCLFRRYSRSAIQRNYRAHCSTPARAIG